MMPDSRSDKFIFIWLPVALFIFPHIFLITGGYDRWIMPIPREIGYVENATAFFFLLAGSTAIYLAMIVRPSPAPYFKLTLIAFGALAIWVCLEEVSYGQQYAHFDTPEWFLERNKNREVNIHNLYGDAISYAMKTGGYIGVTVAGIIVPLVIRYKNIKFSATSWKYFFLPSTVMIVPSLFHLFANLPKQVLKATVAGRDIVEQYYYFSEAGEYEEYMLGVWVVLFVVMVGQRLRDSKIKAKGNND
jgi:hypothetical protein